jgi:dTDP-glucose 4,6-dehydratase
LRWHPDVSFNNGIKATIQWYIDNQKWSEHILNGSYILSNNKVALK